MTLVKNLVLVTHFLGLAAILGGYLLSRASGTVSPWALWGARAQLVTGLVLLGLAEASATAAAPVNHTKIGVKLVVALAVVACVEIANARARRATDIAAKEGRFSTVAVAPSPAATLTKAAAALTIVNICVATLWH